MFVLPFEPHHLRTISVQPQQEMPASAAAQGEALKAAGPAYTAVDEDGTVLAVCGVVPQWEGRACAWGAISLAAGPHFVRITREVRKFLDTCGIRRVEAAVDVEFAQAIRWIEMLGFKRETPEPMQGYGFNGRACFLYARVRSVP